MLPCLRAVNAASERISAFGLITACDRISKISHLDRYKGQMKGRFRGLMKANGSFVGVSRSASVRGSLKTMNNGLIKSRESVISRESQQIRAPPSQPGLGELVDCS